MEDDVKATNARLNSCVSDKAKLLLELERARELLSLSHESNAKLKSQLAAIESRQVGTDTSQVLDQHEAKISPKLTRTTHLKKCSVAQASSMSTRCFFRPTQSSTAKTLPNPIRKRPHLRMYTFRTRSRRGSNRKQRSIGWLPTVAKSADIHPTHTLGRQCCRCNFQ